MFHFLDRLTLMGVSNRLSSSVRCSEFLGNIAIFLEKWGRWKVSKRLVSIK